MTSKRTYRRRTDEERIAELQDQIASLQQRAEQRKRPDEAVLKEIPRVSRKLRRFAQMAMNHGREDIANSTLAFLAGLDRMGNGTALVSRRRSRPEEDEE